MSRPPKRKPIKKTPLLLPKGDEIQKNKGGRKSKYTPELAQAYVDCIRKGMGLDEACHIVRIHTETRAAWEKKRPGFFEAIKEAQALFEQDQLLVIREAAVTRYNTDGNVVRRGSWVASAWILERRFHQRYGQRWAGELTGKGGKALIPNERPTVDLSALTTAQLVAMGANLAPIISPVVPLKVVGGSDNGVHEVNGNGNGNGNGAHPA